MQAQSFGRIALALLLATTTARAASAQTATAAGSVRVYSTIYSIGVEWDIAGDTNHSAGAAVAYRIEGTGSWAPAMALTRIDYNGANMLAGSIMFLVPGTSYEVSLTLTDPDGGSASRIVRIATRQLPAAPSGGRTLHVTTGRGDGDGSVSNPFRGIAAAQNVAQPGDVFLLHGGQYGGRVRFDRPGNDSAYIVWRAYGDGEVELAGIDIAASHIWLEGLTVRHQAYATFSIGAPDAVVVRRCSFYNNHYSIYLQQGGTHWYIADNTIVGDTPYSTESFDGEGIELNQTSGHTIAHNSITNVADGISYPLANVDIFGNDIFDTSDDGIEGDYGFANVRIWGNRIHNAVHNGISFQPQNGGPWYILRNQIVGNVEGAFKFRTTDRFVLAHNTIVNWGAAWPGNAMICCSEEHLLRAFSRNNLWISISGGQIWGFDAFTGDWRTDLDYDGFDWGTAANPFSYGGLTYGDLSSFATATGLEGHGTRVSTSCFATFQVPSPPPSPVPAQAMALAPSCAAIDAGAVVPNLNDGFEGSGPDLGAYESGAPMPVYGPRSAPWVRLHLTATRIGAGDSVSLSWTTTDATSTAIDALGAVPPSGFASVAPSETTTYRLTAVNQAGITTATATLEVEGAPPPPPAPPDAPSGLTATAVASDVVRLTWVDESGNEGAFAVERSLDGVSFVPTAVTAADVESIDVTGLSPTTTYVFRVKAFNAAGASAYSLPASATTLQEPLAAPSLLMAAAVSKSQIRLSWQDNSGAETGFRVERSTNNSKYSVAATVGAGVTTFTDAGLRGGQTYFYRVRATAGSAVSPASNVATAATPKK